MTPTLALTALPGLGEVDPGPALDHWLVDALRGRGVARHDVIVLAQKVVSKCEGRFIALDHVQPGPRAQELGALTAKDPRLVQVVLDEATEVLRAKPNVLIVRHRSGAVMAHAGVDRSNVPPGAAGDQVLLLPDDPDRSAERIRNTLGAALGVAPGVVISDSFGRPWRLGVVNVAIGAAGLPALWDRRGETDRQGRRLEVTQVGFADAIAAAAGLLMGEAAEGTPVVWVRGLAWTAPDRPARALVRPLEEDMFR